MRAYRPPSFHRHQENHDMRFEFEVSPIDRRLETETMKNAADEEDRQAVMREALALQCFAPRQIVP